ncbi:hypothetical protein FRC10_005253, partial [Ceratobasidium sp. 414]
AGLQAAAAADQAPLMMGNGLGLLGLPLSVLMWVPGKPGLPVVLLGGGLGVLWSQDNNTLIMDVEFAGLRLNRLYREMVSVDECAV